MVSICHPCPGPNPFKDLFLTSPHVFQPNTTIFDPQTSNIYHTSFLLSGPISFYSFLHSAIPSPFHITKPHSFFETQYKYPLLVITATNTITLPLRLESSLMVIWYLLQSLVFLDEFPFPPLRFSAH